MNYVIDFISNPLSFAGLILSIISVIYAYKSCPQKSLRYQVVDHDLITNKQSAVKNLSIYYNDKSIENLTITKLSFWNASYPTIRHNDIEIEPLHIFVKEGEILSVCVLEGADTTNQIGVTLIDDKTISITFKYLDRKEGGIIQIAHTGPACAVYMSKKILGGKVVHFGTPYEMLQVCTLIIDYGFFFIIVLLHFKYEIPLYIGIGLALIISLSGYCSLLLIHKTSIKAFIPKNCTKSKNLFFPTKE